MGLETALIGSAALGTAGGIFGQEQAKKAQKGQSKSLKKQVSQYEQAQLGNIEQGIGEQERLLSEANRIELEGGEDAIRRFEGAGAQGIEDERQRAVGAGQAALSSRGLLGSSAQANLAIGAGRAASRAYTSLGEAVSSMRQNLAGRRAAGLNRMGALKAYKATAKNNVLANSLGILAGYTANQTPVSSGVDFSGFGQAAGLYAGLRYGGYGYGQNAASLAAAQAGGQAAQIGINALYGGI